MDIKDIWKIVLAQIEVKLESPAHFKTWFKDTTLISIEGGMAKIGVKNSYTSEWLKKRHYKLISSTLSYVYNKDCSLEFVIDKGLVNKPNAKIKPEDIANESPILNVGEIFDKNVKSLLSKAKLNESYNFKNYVVGPSNKLAHAAAMGVARNPGQSYNPLFIYGKTGLGKTHLAQAIGSFIIEKDPEKKVLYVSSEGFLNDMVKSIRSGKSAEFRQKYRTLDLLIIDDIQFLSKWQETQNEFFNTFNVLYNDKKQIILISDRPPQQIEKIEDRLRSRFQGGMSVDVTQPDFETRLAILQQKCIELSIELPLHIIEYIAKLVTDNVREMEGALQKITLYNSMKEGDLSDEEIATILGKDFKSKREKIKPALVIKKVAKEFEVTAKDIKGPRRTAELALARQVCMYLLRQELGYKLEEVAQILERKDHTKVMHAVDKIKSKIMSDDGFKNQVEILINGFEED
jgi:chromosomal replication initiator protein